MKADDPDARTTPRQLVVEKQKDAAATDPILFMLDPVAADTGHGPVAGCRVLLHAGSWTDAPAQDAGPLSIKQLEMLKALRDTFPHGATATEWLSVATASMSQRSCYNGRTALEARGLIASGGSRGSKYTITPAGRAELTAPARAPVQRSVQPSVQSAQSGGGACPPLPRGDVVTPVERGGAGLAAASGGAARGESALSRRGDADEPPADFLQPYREFGDDEAPVE